YLQACQRSRIALVGIGRHSLNDLVKVNAAKQCTAHQPFPVTDRDVFEWSERFEECMEAFLPKIDRYDAVLCPSDYIALLLLNRLKAACVRVPEQIYIASFANLAIGRYCRPSITTITMDYSAIGRYAFSIWQQLQLLTDANLVSKIVAPSRLLIRGTTAYQSPVIPETGTTLVDSNQKDLFYHDPTLKEMMGLEGYFSRRDELDLHVIARLLEGRSYEDITDELYISSSALHYRLSKLYHDLGCRTRKEFVFKLNGVYDVFSCAEDEVSPC
ncbi:MAG: hypothetical protein EOM69_11945, partial [Clostridia bacterium]|nr:hypothetical protein [Clostridia bacterium]